MPANCLIQPYVATQQQQVIAPLYDPFRERLKNRPRFRRPEIPELSLANSLWVASGRWPARGWILLRRGDYNALNPYATNLLLNFTDVETGSSLTFRNLSIVQARCVSRGLVADPNAIYLVELTDLRGLVYNRWFSYPTTSFYNVLAPAYPDQYYLDSLSAGTTLWTWNAMLGDLWGQMTQLRTYPGLPITPTATVQDFSFVGTSAWLAVNDILDLLGCSVAVDLTSISPYSIVQDQADDFAFTTLQDKLAGNLEEDLEYLDTGAGRVPAKVTVYFHRRNQYYGTEETVRLDNLQWTSNPLYAVTVNAPAQFTGAVGEHFLWSEFTVRFDVDGNPLAADVVTANAVAAERVAEYYQRLRAGTLGYLRQTYTGVQPFKTGSRVSGVCWHQSYRDEKRAGFRTEIVNGPEPPWPEVAF